MGLRLAALKGGLSLIAKVAVSAAVFAIDKPYDYWAPEALQLAPGMRVKLPFGKGNRVCEGMVLQIIPGERGGLKEIIARLDDTPVLSEKMLHLAAFLRQRYYCTFYDALHAILPAGLWFRAEEQYMISPALPEDWQARLARSPEAAALLQTLRNAGGSATAQLLQKRWQDPQQLQRLLRLLREKGFVTVETKLARRSKEKTERMILLAVSAEEAQALAARKKKTAPLQSAVLELLALTGSAGSKDLCYFTGANSAVLRRLESLGLVESSQQPVTPPASFAPASQPPDLTLTPAQQQAYDALAADLLDNAPHTALLYGVTGAGKTAVYLQLIHRCLAEGRSALVLVPEIGLTPQLLARFSAHFGDTVAVLHSGLRIADRFAQWQRIRAGQARVVLGTRSAVFAPLEQLGLLILDEEQEHTYKSENSPRYHAREVAQYRAMQERALVVLGSATPSVASMYLAKTGRYRLCRLPERYHGAALPQVTMVDLKQELRAGNGGVVSRLLQQELQKNLDRGEQSILFLNRRGSSPMLLCVDCGFVPQCPNCSVRLTYHSANGRLMCHYCGHSVPVPPVCPSCAGHLKQVGFGTQRLEQELHRLWPELPVLRMDADTVTAANPHEKIFRRFQEEKIPVLIGTQMVAKGLDFPNVTLVGVMDADQALYQDSYRAPETTFSMLTQVVGRAGRGDRPGRAIIQTMTPANTVLQLAARQDYDGFYAAEIGLRQLRRCPPFGDLLIFQFSSPFQEKALAAAAAFRGELEALLPGLVGQSAPPMLLGPAPAAIARVNGRFRYRLTLRCENTKPLRQLIAGQLQRFRKNKAYSAVHVSADCNPYDV